MTVDNQPKKTLFIPLIKMLLDASSIMLAVASGYYLRFYSFLVEFIPITQGIPPARNYFYFGLLLIAVFLLLFGSFSAYRTRFFSSFRQEFSQVLQICLLGILIAMSAAFLYRGFSYSRVVFLLFYVLLNVYLLAGRYLFHRIKRLLLSRGFSSVRVCAVGSGVNIQRVIERLRIDEGHNLDVVSYVAEQKMEIDSEYLGALQELPGVLEKEHGLNGIVIALDHEQHPEMMKILRATEGRNVELFYVPDILDILTANVQGFEIGGMPVLRLKAFMLSGWQGFIKRSFDVTATVLGGSLLMPFMLAIAILVKMSSKGPVFYKQKRVGLDGREFDMLKFRSMRSDAEAATGPVWAQKDDPRVTGIGKFLRRSSMDELPQLINVLKGDMSLVGPRPERKYFVDQFQQVVPQYVERHRVRSGMTGWAQVNGMRGQTPIEERTRYDLYYIENWSVWFDLKIILMTVKEVVWGENAY